MVHRTPECVSGLYLTTQESDVFLVCARACLRACAGEIEVPSSVLKHGFI